MPRPETKHLFFESTTAAAKSRVQDTTRTRKTTRRRGGGSGYRAAQRCGRVVGGLSEEAVKEASAASRYRLSCSSANPPDPPSIHLMSTTRQNDARSIVSSRGVAGSDRPACEITSSRTHPPNIPSKHHLCSLHSRSTQGHRSTLEPYPTPRIDSDTRTLQPPDWVLSVSCPQPLVRCHCLPPLALLERCQTRRPRQLSADLAPLQTCQISADLATPHSRQTSADTRPHSTHVRYPLLLEHPHAVRDPLVRIRPDAHSIRPPLCDPTIVARRSDDRI